MRPIDDCFQHKQLPPISKLVYLFFRHNDKQITKEITMSQQEIANVLALSKDTVYRALKHLLDYNFLTAERFRQNEPLTYYFL